MVCLTFTEPSIDVFLSFDGPMVILTELVRWQAEFLNPGGSVKDRAALYIVKARATRHKLLAFLFCIFGSLFLKLLVYRSDTFIWIVLHRMLKRRGC